jgi:hypothetical protein
LDPSQEGNQVLPSCIEELTMIVLATVIMLVVGAVFGLIAYLIIPGRRNVPLWAAILIGAAAILIGAAAMPLGSLLAKAVGVNETEGVDWIELLIQFVLAVGGVAALAAVLRPRRQTT